LVPGVVHNLNARLRSDVLDYARHGRSVGIFVGYLVRSLQPKFLCWAPQRCKRRRVCTRWWQADVQVIFPRSEVTTWVNAKRSQCYPWLLFSRCVHHEQVSRKHLQTAFFSFYSFLSYPLFAGPPTWYLRSSDKMESTFVPQTFWFERSGQIVVCARGVHVDLVAFDRYLFDQVILEVSQGLGFKKPIRSLSLALFLRYAWV